MTKRHLRMKAYFAFAISIRCHCVIEMSIPNLSTANKFIKTLTMWSSSEISTDIGVANYVNYIVW